MYGPLNSPIRVESVTATSFTFRSLPGHSGGTDKLITFAFSEDLRGDLQLTVTAQGENWKWPKLPLALRDNRAFATSPTGSWDAWEHLPPSLVKQPPLW